MHKALFQEIPRDKIIEVAQESRDRGYPLAVITGYIDKEGKTVITYSYDVNGDVYSYKCIDEQTLPSITPYYGIAAEWFEEEISELMGVEFEGLEIKGRLFLPEEFDGSGQILVTPLSELNKRQ